MKGIMTGRITIALASGSLACGGPTEPACDPCTTSAIVYGTVTDVSGVPVVGAPIDVRIYLDPCPPENMRGGSDMNVPRTNSEGAYSAPVISLFGPFTASCVQVSVNPNVDSRWPTGSSQASGQLDLRFGQGARDSLRVDVQLTQ